MNHPERETDSLNLFTIFRLSIPLLHKKTVLPRALYIASQMHYPSPYLSDFIFHLQVVSHETIA